MKDSQSHALLLKLLKLKNYKMTLEIEEIVQKKQTSIKQKIFIFFIRIFFNKILWKKKVTFINDATQLIFRK